MPDLKIGAVFHQMVMKLHSEKPVIGLKFSSHAIHLRLDFCLVDLFLSDNVSYGVAFAVFCFCLDYLKCCNLVEDYPVECHG